MEAKLHKMAMDFGFESKFKAGEEGVFSGYGSVFNVRDSHDDIIAKGAFTDTLTAWKAKGKLPKMLNQHGGGYFGASPDAMTPIGQWTRMEEDEKGLYCEGKLFGLDTDTGRMRYEAMKAGELDGLSIGFRVGRDDVSYGDGKTEPTRVIKRVDLLEVSIVTFGSNPDALIDSIKSEDIDSINTISEFERFLREAGRFDRKAATALTSRLKRIILREADEAKALAELTRLTNMFKL